jgi:hypothetical protein
VAYDWDEEPPQPIGYEASRSIDLTSVAIDEYEKIIEEVTEAGVTSIWEPDVRSKREDELKEEAQTRAIRNARAKAEALARGFGRELGPVYGIATEDARQWVRPLGVSLFGDPGDDPDMTVEDISITFTPRPVVMRSRVYAVFLLGLEIETDGE